MSERDQDKDLQQQENDASHTERQDLQGQQDLQETNEGNAADQADKLNGDEDSEDAKALQEEEDASDAAVKTEHAAAPAPAGKSNKGWMYVAIGLAVLLVIAVVKPPFGGASETVATVNGTKITKDQLYDTMISYGGDSMLNNLISDELLKQEADKAGVTVTDADIEAEIQTIKKSFSSEDEFNAWLQNYNMTMDSFREQVPQQVMLRKILGPKTGVTDEQVKQYYEDNKANYDTAEQVQASHILVKTKAEAEAILTQLKGGADFATLAKEKSTDEGSKASGGDLGFFQKGVMDAAFEKAAFALKNPGDLSDIVETQFGFHIIKLTEHKAAVASTFEEKKEEIKTLLISQKVSEMSQEWLDGVKAQAKITNKLEEAKAATATTTETGAAGGNAAATTNSAAAK